MNRFGAAIGMGGVLVWLSSAAVSAQSAPSARASQLPPDPATLLMDVRPTFARVRTRGVPLLRSPGSVEARWLRGGASSLLRSFDRELWSCIRRRRRAVDPSVAAALPAELRQSCFWEGRETVAVRFDAAQPGWVRIRQGGWLPSSAIQMLEIHTEFHGALLAGRPVPRWLGRAGDTVAIDEPSAERARELSPPSPEVLAAVAPDERWVYVERDAQVLVAYVGTTPVMITLVSTGRAGVQTTPGFHRIRRKPRVDPDDIARWQRDPRSMPDLPFAQYITATQAIHGAVWHDAFGERRSQGCINLSLADSRWLYDFTGDDSRVYVHAVTRRR